LGFTKSGGVAGQSSLRRFWFNKTEMRRSAEIMKLRLILASLIVLAWSIALTGCDSGAKKEAELALAAAEAALEQTKQELAVVKQNRDLLKAQVAELIKARDAAVRDAKTAQGRIDKLTEQFNEQAEIIRELQGHMQKMQAAIEKL
jgi:chromosome segregation ATPase